MLFFLTGEGRVPPICAAAPWDAGVYFVRFPHYSRLLLVVLRACFTPSTPPPPFVVLLAGVGLPPVSSEIPVIHVHTQLQ